MAVSDVSCSWGDYQDVEYPDIPSLDSATPRAPEPPSIALAKRIVHPDWHPDDWRRCGFGRFKLTVEQPSDMPLVPGVPLIDGQRLSENTFWELFGPDGTEEGSTGR